MSLAEDWKKAKLTFKATTDKKKPSKKFGGFFNQGTGVEASAKKVDTAKTAGDLRTALAQFSKDANAYLKILKTAIADPTTVPATTKGDYVAAVGQLDAVLTKLITTGEGMAEGLEGTDKKEKVDPGALKNEAELNTYLTLRQGLAGTLTKVLSNYTNEAAEILDCVVKARTHTANAKSNKAKGDNTSTEVSIDVVRRFDGKAKELVGKMEKDWAGWEKGDMLKVRTDKTAIVPKTSWSKEKQTEWIKASNTAFGVYNGIQIKIQGIMAAQRNQLKSLTGLLEEAESYSSKGVDASVYAQRLVEINKSVDELVLWVDKKRQGMTNTHDKQKVIAEKVGPTTDPTVKGQVLKQFQTALQGVKDAQPLFVQRQTGLVELSKRATTIPVEQRSVPLVAPGYKQFVEKSKKANTDLMAYKQETQAYSDFLTKAIPLLA